MSARTELYENALAAAQARDEFTIRLMAERDALAERADALERALHLATDDMDWSGGDRDGMPECPWCRGEPETHDADCPLLAARAVLAAPSAPKEDQQPR